MEKTKLQQDEKGNFFVDLTSIPKGINTAFIELINNKTGKKERIMLKRIENGDFVLAEDLGEIKE